MQSTKTLDPWSPLGDEGSLDCPDPSGGGIGETTNACAEPTQNCRTNTQQFNDLHHARISSRSPFGYVRSSGILEGLNME